MPMFEQSTRIGDHRVGPYARSGWYGRCLRCRRREVRLSGGRQDDSGPPERVGRQRSS